MFEKGRDAQMMMSTAATTA